MSLTPASAEPLFRPVTPPQKGDDIESLPAPLRDIAFFRTLARNPIETWGSRHFAELAFPYKLLGREQFFLCDPEGIKRCFLSNNENYQLNHIRKAILTPIFREGILNIDGAKWKQTRRALTPVFSPRNIAGFASIMLARVETFLDELATRNGAVFDLNRSIVALTLDVLADCIVPAGSEFDREAFATNADRMFWVSGNLHPLDFMRAPEWAPRFGRKDGLEAIAYLRAEMTRVLEAERKKPPSGGKDFMSLLLAATYEDGTPLSNVEMVDQLLAFMVAGFETITQALTWTIYLLSEDPGTSGRLFEELEAAPLNPENAHKWDAETPFLQACIDESLRLYPTIPHMSREAIGPDQLAGHDIAPGTEVHLSVWVLHRHHKLWEKPDAFDPMRFYKGRSDIHRFAHLPFGIGPRVCIGGAFAKQEMTIVLAKAYQRFHFELIEAEAPAPIMRISLTPAKPINVRAIERR